MNIISLMKELHYPTNDKGVCQGIALMAERARRCGKYDQFKKRIDYLISLPPRTLNRLLEEAKLHAKEKRAANQSESLTDEDKILLEVEAFFSQIWAYYKPNAIQEFLDLKAKTPLSQQDFDKIEALVYDVDSEDPDSSPLPPPKSFFLRAENENTQENTSLQNFLKAVLADGDLSVGLVFYSGTHAVHVFHDQQKNKWIITNHDCIKHCQDIAELANELLKSFSDNSIANLVVHVFTDKKPEKTKNLFDNLKTIANQSLATVCQDQNINKVDSYGVTALHMSAIWGLTKMAKTLLQAQERIPERELVSALAVAAGLGRQDIAEELLTLPGASNFFEPSFNNPLITAVSNGQVSMVKTFLKLVELKKIDISHYLCAEALIKAIAADNQDIIHVFLDSPNLISKIINEHPGTAYCAQGTVLHAAAISGQLYTVNELLKARNTEVNATDAIKRTPLMMAVQKGHLQIVKALLQHQNIEVNYTKNYCGKTSVLSDAVEYAIRAPSQQRLDILKTLLQNSKINLNESFTFYTNPDDESTRLHCSCLTFALKMGNNEVIKELLVHPKTDKAEIDANQSEFTSFVLNPFKDFVDAMRVEFENVIDFDAQDVQAHLEILNNYTLDNEFTMDAIAKSLDKIINNIAYEIIDPPLTFFAPSNQKIEDLRLTLDRATNEATVRADLRQDKQKNILRASG